MVRGGQSVTWAEGVISEGKVPGRKQAKDGLCSVLGLRGRNTGCDVDRHPDVDPDKCCYQLDVCKLELDVWTLQVKVGIWGWR